MAEDTPNASRLAPGPGAAQDRESPNVRAAFDAIYNWNYAGEIDAIRALYANALERQWIAVRDLPWETGVDQAAFADTFSLAGLPIQSTDFWRNLDPDVKWEISRKTSAFQLSNFLHGEQGALMVAAQLVNCVPDMEAKFYAATQTVDEARHVEVFSAYIDLLDEVHPIDVSIKDLLDSTLETDSWLKKLVGMQIVVEGLALHVFRDMRNLTREPLLKQLLTYVSRDEARHTGYGIKYLSEVLPGVGDVERRELEDFAFEGSRVLAGGASGPTLLQTVAKIWSEAGVDPMQVFQEVRKEREKLVEATGSGAGAYGPIQGFIIPTMKSIGLFSERLAGFYRELLSQRSPGTDPSRFRFEVELPEDLEAWVG